MIYGYSVVHNDAASLGEWLRHQDAFLGQCGPLLQSKLLEIDPIERRTYQHLEYSPPIDYTPPVDYNEPIDPEKLGDDH